MALCQGGQTQAILSVRATISMCAHMHGVLPDATAWDKAAGFVRGATPVDAGVGAGVGTGWGVGEGVPCGIAWSVPANK